LPQKTKSKQLRDVLRFYIPLTKDEELAIWHRGKKSAVDTSAHLPEDERVEDAGLTDNMFDFMVQAKKSPVVVGHA